MAAPRVKLIGGPLDGTDSEIAPPWPRSVVTFRHEDKYLIYELIPGSFEAEYVTHLDIVGDM